MNPNVTLRIKPAEADELITKIVEAVAAPFGAIAKATDAVKGNAAGETLSAFRRKTSVGGRRISRAIAILTLACGASLFVMPSAWAGAGQPAWAVVEQNAQIPALGDGRSAIVVIRTAREGVEETPQSGYKAAALAATVSVFVDGTYHASFPKASWAYAEVCPGLHFLNAVRDQTALGVQENVPYGQRHDVPAGSTSYFQLLEDDSGAPRLQAVYADAALQSVQQLPRASHTISRLAPAVCAPPVEAKPPVAAALPVQARSYTLSAATLFSHDRFTLDALRKGKGELDAIIQDARARGGYVDRIDIKGYADPTGSAGYNLKLSNERAQTIAQYFVGAGFARSVVTARGMGATGLVVADCSVRLKTRAQINDCNEPNRRVEVVVHQQSEN